MTMRIVLAVAFAMGLAGAAQADQLMSAPAYGGPGQSVGVCFYSVNGPVTFTRSVIKVEPNNEVAEVSEFCSGSFSSGRCRTVVNITQNSAYWCEATVSNKAKVRGRMEIRDSSGNILTTQDAN